MDDDKVIRDPDGHEQHNLHHEFLMPMPDDLPDSDEYDKPNGDSSQHITYSREVKRGELKGSRSGYPADIRSSIRTLGGRPAGHLHQDTREARGTDGALSPDPGKVAARRRKIASEAGASPAARRKLARKRVNPRDSDDQSLPENAKTSRLKEWVFHSPTRLIVFSFAFVILTAAMLLNLPLASENGRSAGFLTALFTATSATCVTGLVLVDTAVHWSTFGEIVIIAAVQVGGLGLVTIMSFFLMAAKRRMSLRTMLAMQESTASDSFVDSRTLVGRIILITLSAELTGGLILTSRYSLDMPFRQALRRGMFQGISAFCNAGFDLMGDYSGQFTSLTSWTDDPVVLLTTSFLIIFGGLGFIVWNDLLTRPWRKSKLRYHSRLVLALTGGLLIVSTTLISILEWNNMAPQALGTLPPGQKIMAGFFQAVTLRTAGFNTIAQDSLSDPAKLLGVILMFIGAGPASTGGGIKLTTFAVVIATAIAHLRGEEETVLMRRRVDHNVFMRALVIFMLGVMVLISASFMLSVFEQAGLRAGNFTFLDLMYEAISAFATVGVTSVPTPVLGSASHVVLLICMFLGRVGPASFAMGFTLRQRGITERVVPEGKTVVG